MPALALQMCGAASSLGRKHSQAPRGADPRGVRARRGPPGGAAGPAPVPSGWGLGETAVSAVFSFVDEKLGETAVFPVFVFVSEDWWKRPFVLCLLL